MALKILASVDVHNNKEILERIVEMSKLTDIVVVAGDMSNFERGLREIMEELNNSSCKVLVIPGNHESPDSLIHASRGLRNIVNLHRSYYVLNKVLFLGYGTGGFSLHDAEFVKTIPYFNKVISKIKPEKVVLVTHAPPFGCRVDLIENKHVGNKDITKFIEEHNIDLVICGHLHENAGVYDFIGETMIINPGPIEILEL